MPRQTPRAAWRLNLALAAVASLVGCHTFPQAAPPATAPAASPVVEAETAFTEAFTVDVDPLHGAAFERPVRRVQAVTVAGALRVQVDFTQVKHDAATGRTTVTMQITNAGDTLTYLKCNVSGDRKVIDPAWGFSTTASAAGATQTRDLVFDNPSAGGFSVKLTFTGTLNTKAALPVGAGTAPSTAPTVTPTATPTVTPTATPTPAPTATPATGTLSATADSSYGALTPDRAIDDNLASQWSNDGYQAAEAWLRLDLGGVKAVSSLTVKMRPQSGGATYAIEASTDGVNWQTATGRLKNTSWNLETKGFNAPTNARYLRLHFFNDPASPEQRFSVFEAQVNGASNVDVTPTPAPTPTPTPSSGPVATGSLSMNFDAFAEGADPDVFINPRDEGFSYPWLVNPVWRVTTTNGTKQYMHDGLSNTANLSFRRYRGTALGTANGQLPNHYYAQVDVTPIKSYTYNPTGDQGTQVYYLNPTNYVEVVVKPNFYEVWVANNAEPFSSAGWTRVKWKDLDTSANQTRRIGTEVNANTHTLKVWLDGVPVPDWGEIPVSKLTTQAHYFALRGTGNIVVHDNLLIEPR